MWDLISNVLVTTAGFLYFKESIGPFKKVGVIFSILAMFFMSVGETE
jgi:hypothetical protein